MDRFILVFYFVVVQIELIVGVSQNFAKLHSEDQHGPIFLNNARKGISPWSSDEYIEMSRAIHPLNGGPQKQAADSKYNSERQNYGSTDISNTKEDNFVCTSTVCEYDWVLEERHSMTWRTFDDKKGKLSDYQIKVDEVSDQFKVITNSFRPDPPYDSLSKEYKDPNNHLSQIFTADGRSNRRIITINGKFPGPLIQVTKGAVVKVRVKNNMPIQSASVHWHGIHQTNNYWMDGAPYLSQCPILPKQSFEYVWKAEMDGTFWYHSHLAIQRNDGIFGVIIVHPSEGEAQEMIPLLITDWFQVDSINLLASNPFDFAGTKKSFGTAIHHCLTNTLTYTKGVKISSMCMDSILVNGRGLIRDSNPGLVHQNISSKFSHLGSTTERWYIPKYEKSVTLSLVHGGYEFPVRLFLLDGGSFMVLETDGTRIEPEEVDELILGVGETFVIEIASPGSSEDNIRILRSEILAECRSSECLRYDSIPFADTELYFNSIALKMVRDVVYVSTKTINEVKDRKCESILNGILKPRICRIFNCPWGTSAAPLKYDKIKKDATCINIDQIKSMEDNTHGDGYDEYVPSVSVLLSLSKMAQTENIIVCNSIAEFNERLSNARPKNSVAIAGMYNSLVDRILIGDNKNQGLYTIPIDDHAIVRGHAVFDTATLVRGYLYRHRTHVDRFFESADKAGLSLEFLATDMEKAQDSLKDRLVDIMKQLARATNTDNGMIRMWVTAGPGNFGTTKNGCVTSLYMGIKSSNEKDWGFVFNV